MQQRCHPETRRLFLRLLEEFRDKTNCPLVFLEDDPAYANVHRRWVFRFARSRRDGAFERLEIAAPGVHHPTMESNPATRYGAHLFALGNMVGGNLAGKALRGILDHNIIPHATLLSQYWQLSLPPEVQTALAKAFVSALHFTFVNGMIHPMAPQHDRDDTVDMAMQCIRERVADKQLSVEEIAYASGVTPSYLARLFRNKFGISVRQMLVQTRIGMAQKMLLTPHDPPCIGEIAILSGWQSLAYFSKVFKANTGLTPSAFQAKHKSCREERQ